MENLEYLYIILIISIILILTFVGYLCYITYKIYKKSEEIEKTSIKEISSAEQKEAINLFNILLEEKFQYYFTSEILAYFIQGVELRKEKINELKEMYYLDISNSLTEKTKNKLLTYYSIKGVKLHINQTFLRLLNNANIKYSDNESKISNRTLNAIYNINE